MLPQAASGITMGGGDYSEWQQEDGGEKIMLCRIQANSCNAILLNVIVFFE